MVETAETAALPTSSVPDTVEAASTRRAAPLYIGILFTAMSALLLEVALTRVFAVMMWHHFAYMIVSLALLGFGASGSILTALRIADRRAGPPRLALFATSFGVFTIGCFLLATRLPVDTVELIAHPINFFRLMLLYLILAIPFLFCGLAVGASLTWYPQRVGTLYFFDLVGSAAGASLAPWLLGHLHTDAVIVAAAVIALLGGAAFSLGAPRRRWIAHAVALLAGVVLLVGFAGGGGGVPALHWDIPFAPHKVFVKLYFQDRKSETTLPSATAQVDVSHVLHRPMRMAADFGVRDGQVVNLRGATQDGTAPTVLYEGAADVMKFTGLRDSQAGTSFLAHAAAGGKDPEVLVIGVGGGVDVMLSLFYGAKKVTAVEINRAMIDMVTRQYSAFLGNLFGDPRVHLVREEGRAFVRRSPDRYDVIQLSGTDTFTALSSGVYTLSEGYVYTVEAVMDMYSHLKPGGYINYSRAMVVDPEKPQRETLRLANVAREALSRLGVAEPWRNIAVFQGVNWASTMIRKGAFTAPESARLRDFATSEAFYGLVFDPLHPTDPTPDNGEGAATRAQLSQLVPPDTDAETLGRDGMVLLLGALRADLRGDAAKADAATAAVAARLAAPAERAKMEETLRTQRRAAVDAVRAELAYRRGMIASYQTVLHAPRAEQRQYVADYPYDVRPSSDDKPFFFDYFKVGSLRQTTSTHAFFNEILPEFPVGHAVLAASFVQLVIWAALFILLPLRALPPAQAAPGQKARIFTYFAMLGCGFMFVEISLMQKLVLFLGHPVYSLSVVLASLLAFSGLGALSSSRLAGASRRALPAALAAVVGLLILDRLCLDGVLAAATHLDRPWRILLTVLILAPTAFALGFPFPLGIRLVRERAPVLIPWAWAVNGFLSVAGSLLAVMLAMAAGFSAVMLAGAASYLVALLVIARSASTNAPGLGFQPALPAGGPGGPLLVSPGAAGSPTATGDRS